MGTRLLAFMEDGIDLDDEDGSANWEFVGVAIEGYRRMGDPSFRRHFRLTKPCFEILIGVVANHLVNRGRIQRVRTALDVILMMVLWILANPDTFRSVALRFGFQPGTVHYHYCYIIEALREMAPQYISWPSIEERQQIKEAFQAYSGFPDIVGVIDGTHNPIIAPVVQKLKYRKRHHAFSINTQVVCDHRLLIRDVKIGEVGSMHDQRVLTRSALFPKLLHPEENFMLPDEHLIGDGGYTNIDTLITPVRNVGNLTDQQRRFNRSLCKNRARVEHCNGKTFGQWRRMKYLHCINLDLAVDHIMACFVLHNFMIVNGEVMMDLENADDALNEDEDDVEEIDEEETDGEEIEGGDGGVPLNQQLREAKERRAEKRWHLVFSM